MLSLNFHPSVLSRAWRRQGQAVSCWGHLPPTSVRIKSLAAAVADLGHPRKEFRVDIRNALGCRGNGRIGLQRVRSFQVKT